MIGYWWVVLAAAQEGEFAYSGGFDGSAPNYVAGKPVVVAHSQGNLSVRCVDTDTLSARIRYSLTGSSEAGMKAFGDGIGMSVSGDAAGGSVKSRVPSSKSGVTTSDVQVTVNIPAGTKALTITHSGKGWVEVLNCSGALKVTAGTGGAYASGKMTALTLTASGGDVKVEPDKGTPFTGAVNVAAPGGSLSFVLPSAQGGKLNAKAAEVTVSQTVMGTNTATLVSGDLGLAGPNIALSARDKLSVTAP